MPSNVKNILVATIRSYGQYFTSLSNLFLYSITNALNANRGIAILHIIKGTSCISADTVLIPVKTIAKDTEETLH